MKWDHAMVFSFTNNENDSKCTGEKECEKGSVKVSKEEQSAQSSNRATKGRKCTIPWCKGRMMIYLREYQEIREGSCIQGHKGSEEDED